jgi:transcription-repair coupling factor (superfamily II helicase)
MSEQQGDDEPFTGRLHHFPSYDISPLTGLRPHREVITRRIQSLYALLSDEQAIVVTSLDAVFSKILPKDSFVRSLEYVETNEEVARDALLERLMGMGYQRVSLVEEVGDFSVRGGVIDLFSPLYPVPIRLEFWGDRLESIRHFDTVSQRSQDHLEEAVLLPANEILIREENLQRARSMGRLPFQPNEGQGFPGQEAWLNHFYEDLDTPIRYLPKKGLLMLFEPQRIAHAHTRMQEKFSQDVRRFQRPQSGPHPSLKWTGSSPLWKRWSRIFPVISESNAPSWQWTTKRPLTG